MTPQQAVETFVNGNISEFKAWLKKSSKLAMLDAIEYYSGNIGSRHVIITYMRSLLTE